MEEPRKEDAFSHTYSKANPYHAEPASPNKNAQLLSMECDDMGDDDRAFDNDIDEGSYSEGNDSMAAETEEHGENGYRQFQNVRQSEMPNLVNLNSRNLKSNLNGNRYTS